MGLSLPFGTVPDPACQGNWDGVRRADLPGLQATVDATVAAVAVHESRLDAIGTTRSAASSVVQGPGPVGADVVYTPISIVVDPGTWLIYAQATASASVADGMQLALHNGNTGFELGGSTGAVEGSAAAGASVMLATLTTRTFGISTPISIRVKRNGASALTVGYPGVGLTNEQRLEAVKIAAAP